MPKFRQGAATLAALIALLGGCVAEESDGSTAGSGVESVPAPRGLAAPLRGAAAEIAARGVVHAGLLATMNVQRAGGQDFVDVIVRTTGATSALTAHARAVGLRVAAVHAGPALVMGAIPIEALPALAQVPGVLAVEPARPFRTQLDLSVPAGSPVHSMNVTPGPDRDGTGVTVGVLDTGIDFTHADFIDPATGLSRVRYIWDQTDCADAAPPVDDGGSPYGCGGAAAGPCGSVYDADQINCAIEAPGYGPGSPACAGRPPVLQQDTDGHGTHVASTAAGRIGVAPNADIVVVKFDFDDECGRNSSIAIIEGARFIFDHAVGAAAVNMSLGSDVGPHTGLTGEETGLSALTGPGRHVVVAAGNAARHAPSVACSSDAGCAADATCAVDGMCDCSDEGLCVNGVFGYPIHGSGQIVQGQTRSITVHVPSSYDVEPQGENYVAIDLWYGLGVAATASVDVYPPGESRAMTFSWDRDQCRNARRGKGRVCLWHTDLAYWEIEGLDNELWIQIDDGGGFAPASGDWRIDIRGVSVPGGSTAYDAWLLPSYNFTELYAYFHTGASCGSSGDCGAGELCHDGQCATRLDSEETVGSPATAHGVLAVAAYTTRNQWTDMNGQPQGYGQPGSQVSYYGQMPVDALAFFSSRGGARLPGLDKPEIATPGAGIVAALSHWTFEAEEAEYAAGGRPYFYPGRIVSPGPAGDGRDATCVLQGTSMATPHATGGVAVLLQRNPALSPAGLLDVLAGSASTADGATDPAGWGLGRFDVDAALALMSCASDADCDDGVLCNGAETCDLGTGECVAGADLPAGTSCEDGAFCNGAESCDGAGACVAGVDPCDDGLFCNGAESCDEGADACGAGAPVACDDGEACNGVETCDEGADACAPGTDLPAGTSCEDGAFCNGVEVCDGAGACAAGADPCDDGLFCNGAESCDEGADSCGAGTPVACDDGVYCNGAESCDEGADACVPGTPPSDPICVCLPRDAECSTDADCCGSLRCKPRRGVFACR